MLQSINRQLEKAMPIITPTSVIIGVLLSDGLKSFSELVPWIFAFMTFAGSLNSDLKSLRSVIYHPFPILVIMFILHVLMPLWAWSLGHLLFGGDVLTIAGLILAVVIPTGITSFIWVSIYKGNHALALSVILIDTLLSPFIVPYSLSFLVGEMVVMDSWAIMKGLLSMIVLPSITGMILNQCSSGKITKQWGPRLAPFSKIGLGIVVMINSAEVAPYLMEIDFKLFFIGAVACFIASSGYMFSLWIGKILKLDRENMVTLIFCGGMRNITAGAVIAIAYFPKAVAVPVVLGMLFQQVLASLFGHMLSHYIKYPELVLDRKHSA